MPFITQLLLYLIPTTGFVGGLIFLAKLVIEKIFESGLEKYKNTLQQDTEKFRHSLTLESEKFRHDLNKASIEHQVKYTKLYEKRGEIIRLTYNQFLELENSLANVTTVFQGPDWFKDTEREEKALKCNQALKNQLEQNRIFFSEKLCEEIELILEESKNIVRKMIRAKVMGQRNEVRNRKGDLSFKELVKPLDTRGELDKIVQTEIKAARLNLAQEFRALIGVS
jgi:dsDNA-binding SOS-regulon protein